MSIVEKNQENAKKVQFEGKRVNNCNLCGFENQCLTMLVLTANQGNKIWTPDNVFDKNYEQTKPFDISIMQSYIFLNLFKIPHLSVLCTGL